MATKPNTKITKAKQTLLKKKASEKISPKMQVAREKLGRKEWKDTKEFVELLDKSGALDGLHKHALAMVNLGRVS